MARILAPDYPGQQVIAGIKALALDGDTCDMAWDFNWLHRAFKSRYVNRFFSIPSAETDPRGYVKGILELLEHGSYDLLMPFGNHACHQAALAQEEISKRTRLLVPAIQNHLIAFDKSLTYQRCLEIGIPVPKTITDVPLSGEYDPLAHGLQFPLVIKTKSGSGVKSGVRFVEKPQDFEKSLSEIYGTYASRGFNDDYRPILQEFIPGSIHDACITAQNGIILTFLSQVRHLMYPISGGVGAINTTTHNDALFELVKPLVKSLNWSGPAQIEFKFDERDRQYKLIEINPKLWGTLDLAIQSGVNFPLVIRDALMGAAPRTAEYESGNYYFFLFPQATLASIEKVKIFGWKSLKIQRKIRKKFYDVDLTDPLPIIPRFLKTIIKALPTLIARSKPSIDKKFINP